MTKTLESRSTLIILPMWLKNFNDRCLSICVWEPSRRKQQIANGIHEQRLEQRISTKTMIAQFYTFFIFVIKYSPWY